MTGTRITITTTVGMLDYPILARLAEHHDAETIGGWLEVLLDRLAATQSPDDEVEILTRAGWCDADMARELNTTNAAVAGRRRRLGLPANPRRKARP